MLTLRAFINLFFVPALALYILYRQREEEMQGTVKMLMQYSIITACNIPMTRVITFIIRKVAGTNIEADSSYYTVAALIAAVLLPYLYENWKRLGKQNNG